MWKVISQVITYLWKIFIWKRENWDTKKAGRSYCKYSKNLSASKKNGNNCLG